MTVEELLLELKDIAPPPEPDWWLIPPACLIALCSIIAIAVLTWFIFRYRRLYRVVNRVEQELQRISSLYSHNQDARQLGLALSKWLKQVSILAFPHRRTECLSGENWLKFLDESFGSTSFRHGRGRVFGGAIYSERVELDGHQLVELCAQWLPRVRPHLLQRSRG